MYDPATATWTGPSPLLLARDRQHPGAAADAVRSWAADRDGEVRITGRVLRPNAAGDGVRAEIVHRSETIWSADIVAGDAVGTSHDVTRRVAKGDEVHFRVGRRVNVAFDSTAWDPLIVTAP